MPRVHIEFQRVQAWLFTVPRLRAMVGANALLGETLRVKLPELARDTGKGWTLEPSSEIYPSADPNDPLKDHDDPAADANDGILSRDGGHFEARFSSGAETFADEAEQLLRSKLPGLRFQISIDDVPRPRSKVHLSTELPVLAPCEWTGVVLHLASSSKATSALPSRSMSRSGTMRRGAPKTAQQSTSRACSALRRG